MLIVTQPLSACLACLIELLPRSCRRREIFGWRRETYVARLALTEEERAAAYRLRFVVFNLEMNEGLESAYADGYDKDHFDDVCDHLIVEDT